MKNEKDTDLLQNTALKEVLTERPNLFEPNDLISIRLLLSGNVPADRIKEAMERTYESNEVTLSKLVFSKDGRVFYERMKKSGCHVFLCKTDWRLILKENERKPFDLLKGEFLRSFIIEKENETELLIMAHHLSGDGNAMICFIEEFLEILIGKQPGFQPLCLINREMASRQKKLSFVIRNYLHICNRKWNSIAGRLAPNGAFSSEEYQKVYEKYWEQNQSVVLEHSFTKEETDHILKNAKETGVTVNSFLVTAFAQSGHNIKRIGIPVSVREEGNRSMANYTGGIEIFFHYDTRKTFQENALILHKRIQRKKNSKWRVLCFLTELPPVMFDAMLLARHGVIEKEPFLGKMAETLNYAENKTRDLGVTNLMQLPFQSEYGDVRLVDFTFLPPKVTYSKNVIGVSTFMGRLKVTCHAMMNHPETKEMFERGIQVLFS